MLSTAVAAILMLGALALVAAPFLQPEPEPEPLPSDTEGRRHELNRRKTEAYAALRDAEMDFRMGKLSEVDYEALKAKYTNQAIEALAGLDCLPPEVTAPALEVAERTAAIPTDEVRFCPDCGTPRPDGARFCPSCGSSLLRAA